MNVNSWAWVSSTLKSLRIGGSKISPSTQSRLFGAQPATVEIPVRPKRPLTPYFRFLGKVREGVKKENPSLKPAELMKLVAVKWDKLDEGSKLNYNTDFKKEMESYSTILQKYNQSLSPQQKEAREQLKLEKQMQKEKREKRKRYKELGKPKKPVSAFLAFLKNKVPPGSSITVYQTAAKTLGAKWKSMTDEEKAPFIAKYQEDLQIYGKTLAKWEEKMLKQGNDDLVRQSQIVKPSKQARSETGKVRQ